MQFPLPTSLVGLLVFFTTAKAVFVCSGFLPGDGGCNTPCTEFDIALGEEFETPNTNCIYNSVEDPGFNLVICSGPGLTGDCSTLAAVGRVTINGDFNWDTPNTNSISRNGA